MLLMNYLANTIGVCVVIFVTYRAITQQFAHWIDYYSGRVLFAEKRPAERQSAKAFSGYD